MRDAPFTDLILILRSTIFASSSFFVILLTHNVDSVLDATAMCPSIRPSQVGVQSKRLNIPYDMIRYATLRYIYVRWKADAMASLI